MLHFLSRGKSLACYVSGDENGGILRIDTNAGILWIDAAKFRLYLYEFRRMATTTTTGRRPHYTPKSAHITVCNLIIIGKI
jgi:hypothetical protein